jgi:hypothetical protein
MSVHQNVRKILSLARHNDRERKPGQRAWYFGGKTSLNAWAEKWNATSCHKEGVVVGWAFNGDPYEQGAEKDIVRVLFDWLVKQG